MGVGFLFRNWESGLGLLGLSLVMVESVFVALVLSVALAWAEVKAGVEVKAWVEVKVGAGVGVGVVAVAKQWV